jgi:hypothetical protein
MPPEQSSHLSGRAGSARVRGLSGSPIDQLIERLDPGSRRSLRSAGTGEGWGAPNFIAGGVRMLPLSMKPCRQVGFDRGGGLGGGGGTKRGKAI